MYDALLERRLFRYENSELTLRPSISYISCNCGRPYSNSSGIPLEVQRTRRLRLSDKGCYGSQPDTKSSISHSPVRYVFFVTSYLGSQDLTFCGGSVWIIWLVVMLVLQHGTEGKSGYAFLMFYYSVRSASKSSIDANPIPYRPLRSWYAFLQLHLKHIR